MPGRIPATHRTVCSSLAALTGATLVAGLTFTARLHAAPFAADAAVPSVLAATTDDPASGDRRLGDRATGRAWDGAGDTNASDYSIADSEHTAESPFDCVIATDDGGCHPGTACGSGSDCDAPGLLQYFKMCHDKTNASWVGRTDALILWRNAPPGPTIVTNDLIPGGALNASGMDSPAAAGPRFSLFRVNKCTGNAIEATYLRAANFRSLRPLAELAVPYTLPAPGIYGNTGLTFDSANADLGARVQSFELNRHMGIFPSVRFLAGFRWIEWQEQFSMQANSLGGVSDYFQTNCINDLYGGQIGLDANLFSTRWIRFDSVVKAGAYYNNAVQSSLYTTNDPANPGTASVTVGQSPLSGAFAGEVGLTGSIPITCCLDFRFGYFGLWLSGIAQPTRQLADQQLTPGQPEVGTINSNGGVLVQGASVGLEGRW